MSNSDVLAPEDNDSSGHDEEEVERCSDDYRESEEILKNFQRIGISQLVFGCISIILGIVTTYWASHFERGVMSAGVWCGIFALAAGSLAITAKYHLNKEIALANIVVVSISMMFGIILVIISGFTTFHELFYRPSSGIAGLSLIQCAIALAWTTSCLYHLIVFSRISKLASQRTSCCPTIKFGDSYSQVPIAYVANDAGPSYGSVFMAAPASGK